MTNEPQFEPKKYVNAAVVLRMTGATDADIERGLLAAEAVLIESGIDVWDACRAATTQRHDDHDEPNINTSDDEWEWAEVWRNAEREAIEACSAGRTDVYADVGQGLSIHNGPGRWHRDNPYSVAIGTNIEELGLEESDLWHEACNRFDKALFQIFGTNNAVAAMCWDATDPDNPMVEANPSATRTWQEEITLARANGDRDRFEDLVRLNSRPHRLPRAAAQKRWELGLARARAAAMEGMPANPSVQFTVDLYMTE